jgi:hypothetical protein
MILPSARPSVIAQQDGQDFFLLDPDNGEVFQVNATTVKIFALCREGATVDRAVSALAEGLDVAGQEAEIRADVERTAAELCALGLCETG